MLFTACRIQKILILPYSYPPFICSVIKVAYWNSLLTILVCRSWENRSHLSPPRYCYVVWSVEPSKYKFIMCLLISYCKMLLTLCFPTNEYSHENNIIIYTYYYWQQIIHLHFNLHKNCNIEKCFTMKLRENICLYIHKMHLIYI